MTGSHSVPVLGAGQRRLDPDVTTRDGLLAWLSGCLECDPEDILDDDSLVELGLDSLSVMRLPGLLALGGVTVKVSELMAAASLQQWWALIASRKDAEAPVLINMPAEGGLTGEWSDDIEPRAPFALTDAQRAYWLGRNTVFELGGVAAHGYLELACRDLDATRLEAALNTTIRRHPMLRMVIDDDGLQRVLPEVPTYAILRQTGAEQAEHARREMGQAIFSADRWPLFDIRLTQMGAGEWRLHIGFDVLAVDLASLDLWIREWRHFYDDPQAILDAPNIGFHHYVQHLEAKRNGPEGQAARQWWDNRLDSLPACPDLPLACDPGSISAPQFSRLSHHFPAVQWDRLKQAAAKAQVTPSALVLTVLAEVLAQWSRTPHFTLNLTLFNRNNAGLDVSGVLGDFTSLLLVEADLRQQATFAARANALQAEVWRGVDHALVSGVEVIGRLAERRHQQGRAVMPVVFTSALGAGSYLDAVSVFGDVVHATNQTPQVWLDVQAIDHQGGVTLIWDSVEGLFPSGLLDAMMSAQVRLLETLCDVQEWDQPVPVLAPIAQVEQRLRVNGTPRAVSSVDRLEQPFLTHARQTPDAVAVIAADRTLSYGDLDRASARLARRLLAEGACPNRLVGVVMDRGWQQVVAVMAILRAGAAYLPLDASLPIARITALMTQAEATLALVSDVHGTHIPAGKTVLTVDETLFSALEGDGDPVDVVAEVSADDLAYVIFTSGSTGVPKGVMIEHRAAVNTILDINDRYGVSAHDRVLSVSALGFDLSVYDIFGLLAAGGAVVLPPPSQVPNPAQWVAAMAEHGVSVWNSVPALLRLLTDQSMGTADEDVIRCLRLVMTSGDWLPVPLARRMAAVPGDRHFVSLGGATEASIWSIARPITDVPEAWSSVPYGTPLANQRFYVLDRFLRPRPDWVAGDLYIGGMGLARGYWRDADRSARSFIRHPHSGERLYRTGDMGRMLPSGEIEFLGREDDQVKVNGLRIELGEIEIALSSLATVKTAAVTVVRSAQGDRLAGFVVPTPGAVPIEADLQRQLRARLPSAWVPTTLQPITAIPLSKNGKVDRTALAREAERRSLKTADQVAPPGNALERKIAALWEKVLETTVHSVTQSFFDAGGTSLQATRLAGDLSALLKQDGARAPTVSVITLFEHVTVAAQARFLGQFLAAPGSETSSSASSAAQNRAGTRQALQRAMAQARQGQPTTEGV